MAIIKNNFIFNYFHDKLYDYIYRYYLHYLNLVIFFIHSFYILHLSLNLVNYIMSINLNIIFLILKAICDLLIYFTFYLMSYFYYYFNYFYLIFLVLMKIILIYFDFNNSQVFYKINLMKIILVSYMDYSYL